jgi:uncharacterized RDD family membrane protein YckC
MKCPKCAYFGFESSDRCKNCGYDFSLLVPAGFPAYDLEIQAPAGHSADSAAAMVDVRLDEIDGALDRAAASALTGPDTSPQQRPTAARSPAAAVESSPISLTPGGGSSISSSRVPDAAALPLFLSTAGDDVPLITVPANPRTPLSVRRTPESPRPRQARRLVAQEPALDFHDEPDAPEPALAPAPSPEAWAVSDRIAGRRLGAVAIDGGLLLAIDGAILYFTLRMTGLAGTEISAIPIVPFGLFLALMKFGYFSGFTAVGGQTVGKMAVGIRVVAHDMGAIEPAAAVRRTLASVIDVVTLGLAYLPALVGPDRRAVHDRMAGTRVIVRNPA